MAADAIQSAREQLRPYVERAKSFSGWMAYVENRKLGPDHPWDYMARAREVLNSSTSVLDLGTGGGERFGDLLEGFSGRAVATEEWEVNAPIAARRLRPLGAALVWCNSLA